MGAGAKFIARDPWPALARLDVHAYATTRAQFESKLALRFGEQGPLGHPRLSLLGFYTPFSYYGPGNDPPAVRQVIYKPLGASLALETVYALWSAWHLRLGASAQAMRMTGLEAVSDSLDVAEVLPESMPGVHGGGEDLWEAALEWDTRDEEELPSRGGYAGARFGHSSPASDFAFGRSELFAVGYWQPWAPVEIAAKALHRAVYGEAPFYDLPVLGERKILRGIPDRRLRDRQAEALQSELRYTFHLDLPVIARYFGNTWQIAAFGEMGRVEKDLAALHEARWHPAGGVGGRLLVGRRLGALRGDLGFSGYGFGLYVDFNQAF